MQWILAIYKYTLIFTIAEDLFEHLFKETNTHTYGDKYNTSKFNLYHFISIIYSNFDVK